MYEFWYKSVWIDMDGWTIEFSYCITETSTKNAECKAREIEKNFEKDNKWADRMRFYYRAKLRVKEI